MTTIFGVVGPIGSGKTTMIQKTFGVEIRNELNGNTHDVHFYDIEDVVKNDSNVMDFPGSDSAYSDARQNASNAMQVPTVFIVLIDGSNKSPSSLQNTANKEIIDTVIKTGKPFLIIFTQIDRLRLKNEADLEKHKKELIDSLISCSDELKKLALQRLSLENPQNIFWMAVFRPEHDFIYSEIVKTPNDMKNWIQFFDPTNY